MQIETMVWLAAIIVPFATFAVVLMWVDFFRVQIASDGQIGRLAAVFAHQICRRSESTLKQGCMLDCRKLSRSNSPYTRTSCIARALDPLSFSL